MQAAATGRLRHAAADLGLADALPGSGAAVALTLSAAGYPDAPRSGDRVLGVAEARAAGGLLFGAGLATDAQGELVTAGGRVLTVVGRAEMPAEALTQAYAAAAEVSFDGCQMRGDIAAAWREVAIA